MFLGCMLVAAEVRFTKESNNSRTLSSFNSLFEQDNQRLIQGCNRVLLDA